MQIDPALERTYVPLAADEIFIFDLFTQPDFRRRGIQSQVLHRILTLGREKGLTRALSLVAVDNHPSLKLHEKHGFTVISRFTKRRMLGLVRFSFHPNPFGQAGTVIRWL